MRTGRSMTRLAAQTMERTGREGRTSRLGRALGGSVLLAASLVLASTWHAAAAPSPAVAAEASHLVVVEDDGTLLEPPTPFPFNGRRIVLAPTPEAGYRTHIEAGVVPTARGARLAIDGETPVHVALARPVSLYGTAYTDLYVHPHGAVSFGAPLAEGTAARAADPADMLTGLLAGPPVVAGLWNELAPLRAQIPDAGVYVAELSDRVVVTWLDVPSVRPADEPNSFRIVLHRTGRVDLEYLGLATLWGVVGISPGRGRSGTDVVDLATGPEVGPGRALVSWYRDRPRLNEVALARRIYSDVPDQFDFLAVFTDREVDGPHLVGSVTVANRDRGIGMPVFDHGPIFGSRNLEHIVLMNALSFYDEDPSQPPRIPSYAYSPSTLAVLAHETGHRWLAYGGEPLVPAGHDGHWSSALQSDGSFMGGSRLADNADGTFTTGEVLTRFGALDQYFMGVRPPEEVKPFFVVEEPSEEMNATGAPAGGVTFRGRRRDLTVDDVISQYGAREPSSAEAPHVFRMGFVLLVSNGNGASSADVAKLERIRRTFGPFFRRATDNRARVRTWLPRSGRRSVFPRPASLPREPFILGVGFEPDPRGGLSAHLDFLDVQGDLRELELTTDVSSDLPPARIDLVRGAFGSRRGTVSFSLRDIPAQAREIQLTLIDANGLRSNLYVAPFPTRSSET